MCSDWAAALRWMVSRGRCCRYKPPHPIPTLTISYSQCPCPNVHFPIPNTRFSIPNAQWPSLNAKFQITNSQWRPRTDNVNTNTFSLNLWCLSLLENVNCLPASIYNAQTRLFHGIYLQEYFLPAVHSGWKLCLTVAEEAYRGRCRSGQKIWRHICPKYYKRPFFHPPRQGRLCKHHISPWPNQPTQMADQLV